MDLKLRNFSLRKFSPILRHFSLFRFLFCFVSFFFLLLSDQKLDFCITWFLVWSKIFYQQKRIISFSAQWAPCKSTFTNARWNRRLFPSCSSGFRRVMCGRRVPPINYGRCCSPDDFSMFRQILFPTISNLMKIANGRNKKKKKKKNLTNGEKRESERKPEQQKEKKRRHPQNKSP